MLILLSPAKKLLVPERPYLNPTSSISFSQKTVELARLLKQLDPSGIADLMKISNDLATINYQRFQELALNQVESIRAYPAIFLFRGDVYKSLSADQWDKDSLEFAQSHLMILSGLYGLLRPLDLIQPYRLEMGTKLSNSCGKDLYVFWKDSVTTALNHQMTSHTHPIILNLASTEYGRVIDEALLINAPLVTVHFKEQKGHELKVIGLHAKKARGAMANYIIQHKIDDLEGVKAFNLLQYQYVDNQSDVNNLVFIRHHEGNPVR